MSLFRELALAKGFSGGGGNPNRVQTITGTLANPWANVSIDEYKSFCEALEDNGANAIIEVKASALGLPNTNFRDFLPYDIGTDYYLQIFKGDAQVNGTARAISFIYSIMNNVVALNQAHYGEFEVTDGSGSGSVTDLSQYASLIPTTLTIIWHPLPDQS